MVQMIVVMPSKGNAAASIAAPPIAAPAPIAAAPIAATPIAAAPNAAAAAQAKAATAAAEMPLPSKWLGQMVEVQACNPDVCDFRCGECDWEPAEVSALILTPLLSPPLTLSHPL